MSNRPGTPKSYTNAAIALGAAAGVNFPLDPSAQNLIAVAIVYVATATGGNRAVVIRVLNAAGNILWSAAFGTAVTSGQTSRLEAGAGAPSTNTTTPLQQSFPLPIEFSLEPNSSLQILDASNVDTADTVQVNILVTH